MKLHLLLSILVTTAVFLTAQDRDAADSATSNSGSSRSEVPPADAVAPSSDLAKEDSSLNTKANPDDDVRRTDEKKRNGKDKKESIHAAEHQRASEIIGMDISNLENEKVGSVDDLAVDLSSGRITAVIISSGGFLGIANELSIVPPAALTLDQEKKAFSANITKDQLTNAPHFQGSEYPDLNDQKFMLNVYNAYQAESYLEDNRTETTVDGGQRILRASEILGMDVNNHQDETIGDINDLILNQSFDRITSVVVSSGGFLGIGNTLSVLPAETVTTTKDAVLINATKETLEQSPRFAENAWPERMNESSYILDVYAPYQFRGHEKEDAQVSADVATKRDEANNSRSPVNEEKDSRSLTAQDQSNAPGDLDATTQIRREIVTHDDLSFAAKNIRVITLDGKVTVTGHVASEEEIETILKIVRDKMGEGQVTNKLKVEN